MKRILAALVLVAIVGAIAFQLLKKPFPPDTTPEGAYLRIAKALTDDAPAGVFPYLETEAQWACFTVRDDRAKARALVEASYPEPQRSDLAREYEADAHAKDGAEVFVHAAKQRGWLARLRRDLSGVARVDVAGERASVVTARGTRYAFRKRDNGIWGLTMFAAELLADAQRAARDLAVVSAAAEDYERGKKREP